ncbi:MAG TPA: transposase [Cyanobacteria bacterium UBA11369]|nr:transposase [Cyanobacteria bacterium UBA11371]HBE35288.1 transposase [Cyanobacteria bacterium UBA11368]HBE52903.1 transposase [Cyanobacteria bacterium UBA11369]
MLVFEFKAYGKPKQFSAIDEALRTVQFIRNKALRFWMDGLGKTQYDLNKYCAVLAKEFPFCNELNSMARQASAERAWSAITNARCSTWGNPKTALARFYDSCKKQIPLKKGFPQFQKNNRSVEYKSSGWKLADNRKSITFTDKKRIGTLKLKGTRDLHFYQPDQIKRVRLVKRADGYYVQFCVSVDRTESVEVTGTAIGLDVGLNDFYTDSNNQKIENPRFLAQGERRLKMAQKRVAKRVKGSKNRRKARQILGKRHLKISRQRKDHAVKLARCVITSNDVVAYEDLRIKNMVRNHCLAKSINDASWYQFRVWLEYFGKVFGKITIAVTPNGTSQECSSCKTVVKKGLSTRTHICRCGCVLGRDHNAARNILSRGLATVGHTGSYGLEACNAWGEDTATHVGASLHEQVTS